MRPTGAKLKVFCGPLGGVRGPMVKNHCSSAKSTRTDVDILSPAAVENVYYISHNAVDCLEFRGFGWPKSNEKGKKNVRRKSKLVFAKPK
ncbi:small lysine-rich protein 1 [Anarhichas minor]|uniref:small lysine-rich protein 1 n=1 Tax=Anarhichas minor TaxID=65739 RepID=UPI003F735884